MKTQIVKAYKSASLLIWIVGIAIILLGVAGIAAIMGWIPALVVTGLGIAGGAVVGGLLGNQIGVGRGNDMAKIEGAVEDAIVGNQIEKLVESIKSYDITLLFENGLYSVISEENQATWRSGVRVKVINGVIRPKVDTRRCNARKPALMEPNQANHAQMQTALENAIASEGSLQGA